MNSSIGYAFSSIYLKPFEPADVGLLLDVRNDPYIRKGMLNSAPIAWKHHEQWTRENLIEKRNVHVFFIYRQGELAGFSSLKTLPNNLFEIGVMVKKVFTRTKVAFLSAVATGKICFDDLGADRILSKVPRTNLVALDFNQRLGFELDRTDDNYFYLRNL